MVHVFRPFQQLLHVKLDLRRRQLHPFVLQKPGEIVIHVRKDHVYGHWLTFPFTYSVVSILANATLYERGTTYLGQQTNPAIRQRMGA